MNGDNSDETVIIGGDAFLKELAEMLGTDVALCGNVFDGQLPVNVDINKFLGAFRQ